MDRHCENAQALATALARHASVEKVYYPGLASHPGHALAQKQMKASGGMLSFELAGGIPAANAFATATEIFTLAESLGGVESLIEVPAVMTHASIPAEERRKAGLSDGLVRLSVGIEHVDDPGRGPPGGPRPRRLARPARRALIPAAARLDWTRPRHVRSVGSVSAPGRGSARSAGIGRDTRRSRRSGCARATARASTRRSRSTVHGALAPARELARRRERRTARGALRRRGRARARWHGLDPARVGPGAAPQPGDEGVLGRRATRRTRPCAASSRASSRRAQITAQLDHPGVVPVHELGLDSEGRVYFTMKLVKGRDLREVFELVHEGREGWNETRALGVLLKVCEAMAYAPREGRDPPRPEAGQRDGRRASARCT
jgi:hypothetical protein